MDQLLSLQECCLEVITKNIDRFSYAFNTTDDAKLKRNFEFLQRCYTNEIQIILAALDIVNEDSFPLLINKYLREIDLAILDRVDGKKITQMIAEVGEGLVKISFSAHRNFSPDPPLADIFPYLKNITVLNMENACNDEALENIAKYCPHLVELNIAYSLITSDGLRKYLCRKNERNEMPNSNLQKLNLDGTDANDEVTELILAHFPNLEVLEAPSMPCILHKMHQKNIDQNNFSNVKKFKLVCLNAIFCSHLQSSPELLKLYALVCPDVSILTATVTHSDQLNTLASFTKLKNVNLDQGELFPQPTLNTFLSSRGTRLTVLELNGFSFSVDELIKSCPLLEELHLKDIYFQPVVETTTKELKFLKRFYLEGALFADVATSKSVCDIILSAHKLEKICFFCCTHFTDELKEAITYSCIHCPLKKVCFSHSESDLPLLQSILLSSCTLKVLRIVSPSFGFQNLKPDDIELLSDIASNLKNKPKFEYENEESDFDSDGDLHDIFDLYDVFDDYSFDPITDYEDGDFTADYDYDDDDYDDDDDGF